ncbi:GNAT family N-acetyltransferase [Chitinophaga sp. Hz27]|uniref:GNAT family N-acetyltransferase n=1 Tax=Chitinophaga sp. Hz27 TaxID=3347169 RepID=UPI0035D7FA4E
MSDTIYNIVNNTKELQFEISEGMEKAILTYRFYKEDIAFMHTTVPAGLTGKGIATLLARAAFDYAKSLNKPVMVYCPFVASFLKKHPEYRVQLDRTFHH